MVSEYFLLQMVGHFSRVPEVQVFRFFNQRIDDKHLVSLSEFHPHYFVYPVALLFEENLCPNLFSAGRTFIDDRNIQIAVHGHGKRPRDRGGSHNQNVGIYAFLSQGCSLHNSEAMLLVDDYQTELAERNISLDQRVGSAYDVSVSFRYGVKNVLPFRVLHTAREQNSPQTERRRPIFDAVVVLLSKDFSRHHYGRLIAVFAGSDHRRHRNNRLTASHIALQKSVHAGAPLHVTFDLCDDPFLCIG